MGHGIHFLLIQRENIYFSFFKFPLIISEALFLSSFFLEKNEAKKASLLSNRVASKGVRSDRADYRLI